jgi:coenzyme PQQ precursor peptide PqqA
LGSGFFCIGARLRRNRTPGREHCRSACAGARHQLGYCGQNKDFEEDNPMAWTTPILVEICVGLEINGYLPAEF